MGFPSRGRRKNALGKGDRQMSAPKWKNEEMSRFTCRRRWVTLSTSKCTMSLAAVLSGTPLMGTPEGSSSVGATPASGTGGSLGAEVEDNLAVPPLPECPITVSQNRQAPSRTAALRSQSAARHADSAPSGSLSSAVQLCTAYRSRSCPEFAPCGQLHFCTEVS